MASSMRQTKMGSTLWKSKIRRENTMCGGKNGGGQSKTSRLPHGELCTDLVEGG
jgi:hypothetical protein